MGTERDLGLPKGDRGGAVQGRESALWRAAMDRVYPGWRRDDRQASGERQETRGTDSGSRRPELADRKRAREEIQVIFPTETPAPSSVGTSTNVEYFLKKASRLLTNLDDFEPHLQRVNSALALGKRVIPGTFNEDLCRKLRYRVSIMRDVYKAVADEEPDSDPHRDSEDTPMALVDEFIRRYMNESDPRLLSPGMRPEYDAYRELLDAYEWPASQVL